MSYSLVSATDPKDLLQKIVDFATAEGWTIEYNEAAGIGAVGGQIALSSGSCHVAIGEQTSTLNPIAVTNAFLGTNFNDGRLYMALAKSITTANKQFWNHPGSLVTTATDGDRMIINDVWGPLTEVHFFGDENYINVLIKCAADRYTHFGFGNLDRLGMTVPQTGYAIAMYFEFWNTTGAPQINVNLTATNRFPYNEPANNSSLQINIVDDTLDTTIGFANLAAIVGAANVLTIMRTATQVNYSDGSQQNGPNFINDMYGNQRNQPTTGGVQLHRIPIFYKLTDLSLWCYLGEIPDLRLCHIEDLAIASEWEYGADNYKVWPWKRKGILSDAVAPGYNGQPNTYGLGVAFKKVV